MRQLLAFALRAQPQPPTQNGKRSRWRFVADCHDASASTGPESLQNQRDAETERAVGIRNLGQDSGQDPLTQ